MNIEHVLLGSANVYNANAFLYEVVQSVTRLCKTKPLGFLFDTRCEYCDNWTIGQFTVGEELEEELCIS